MAKTYAECEQEIDGMWKRATCPLPDLKEFNAAREAGFMRALAVEYRYELELLRDDRNAKEMHQLLERLGGKCETADAKVS